VGDPYRFSPGRNVRLPNVQASGWKFRSENQSAQSVTYTEWVRTNPTRSNCVPNLMPTPLPGARLRPYRVCPSLRRSGRPTVAALLRSATGQGQGASTRPPGPPRHPGAQQSPLPPLGGLLGQTAHVLQISPDKPIPTRSDTNSLVAYRVTSADDHASRLYDYVLWSRMGRSTEEVP